MMSSERERVTFFAEHVAIRNAILDVAEKVGWKVDARNWWKDDYLWIVLNPGSRRVSGHIVEPPDSPPVLHFPAFMRQLVAGPPKDAICRVGDHEVLETEIGVQIGEVGTLNDAQIKAIFERRFPAAKAENVTMGALRAMTQEAIGEVVNAAKKGAKIEMNTLSNGGAPDGWIGKPAESDWCFCTMEYRVKPREPRELREEDPAPITVDR
jgi:hypothetical protein